MKRILYFFVLIISFSCQSKIKSPTQNITIQENRFARNFSIQKLDSGIIVRTKNIWNFNGDSLESYFLTKSEHIGTGFLKVKIPVKRVVCMSASHVAEIAEIGDLDKIIAVSGVEYIYNPEINDLVSKGKIYNLPSAENLDLESLLEIKPDLIFMYGISSSDFIIAQKIRNAGIPVVFNNDYLEQTALGRAEWMVFMATFFGKYEQANQVFDTIVSRYLTEKNKVSLSQNPSVFLNIPFKDIWYMPGGQSYFVSLIKDAGGEYVFKQDKHKNSLSLDFEYVYNKCNQSDIWLNTGTLTQFSELLDADDRMKYFKAYKQRNVFSPMGRMKENGANDFWESGVVRPDLILKDLHTIFQKKDSGLYFYKRLR